MKKWIWLLAMLLGAGMMVCTGCGGGDDDDGGGSTLGEPPVAPGGTSTGGSTLGEPPVAPGGTSTGGSTLGEPPVAPVSAPTLLAPASGASLKGGVINSSIKVVFTWTAAPGAVDYVLDVNGKEYITTGTSKALNMGWGSYTWQVWTRSNTINMPSAPRSFKIVPTTFVPPGL